MSLPSAHDRTSPPGTIPERDVAGNVTMRSPLWSVWIGRSAGSARGLRTVEVALLRRERDEVAGVRGFEESSGSLHHGR